MEAIINIDYLSVSLKKLKKDLLNPNLAEEKYYKHRNIKNTIGAKFRKS